MKSSINIGIMGESEKMLKHPSDPIKALLMHRVIMKATNPRIHVDHIDCNGLNNSKSNLRLATNSQNQINRGIPRNNTSGFKGVRPQGKKWAAKLKINGKSRWLGTFNTREDARDAYLEAAKRHFGEFAPPLSKLERGKDTTNG